MRALQINELAASPGDLPEPRPVAPGSRPTLPGVSGWTADQLDQIADLARAGANWRHYPRPARNDFLTQ